MLRARVRVDLPIALSSFHQILASNPCIIERTMPCTWCSQLTFGTRQTPAVNTVDPVHLNTTSSRHLDEYLKG